MVWTKEQNKEYQKEYRLKNKKQIKEYRKKYYSKNKEREKKQMREWGLKNKEQIKEWFLKNKQHTRDYERNKYKTDINYKLRMLCRSRIWAALKGNSKSASTMELIGCTIDELRSHLESLFEPWMTWENHGVGGWDIDHIRPCVSFDLTDPKQQRICCNWSNLQPMEHIENIKKRDKIILGDITSPKM